jgi:hypothetical protein
MATRVCVLGDSHCGALKRAWDRMASRHAGVMITFFCQRALGLSGLIVAGEELVPDSQELADTLRFTSEGKDRVVPRDYDVFLIYGLGAIVGSFCSDTFYSRAVVTAALRDLVHPSLSFILLMRLRQLSDKPVFVGHPPLPLAGNVATDRCGSTAYPDRIRLMNLLLYEPLRTRLLPQPPVTIARGEFTDARFSRGSRRLAVGSHDDDELHSDDDNVHMNDEFGSIWMTEFLGNEWRALDCGVADGLRYG